jgi:uncharacterized protein with GYD domain
MEWVSWRGSPNSRGTTRKGETAMVTNVILMKLTHEGARHIKDAPKRFREAIDGFEAMGGKVIAFYAITGEYDYVAIGQAPSDEIALGFVVGLTAQGNVRSTTMRAFSMDEFAGAIEKLPS